MEVPSAKRRKSDEGLLGLLGAYGSEEEEEEENVVEGRASADAIEPFSLLQSHPSAAPEVVVVEPLEPTQTLDIDERVADEAATAQQQMQDPLWLPPEIAKPPEAKCEPEIQKTVSDYIEKQTEGGITISSSLRSLRNFKNPDFLQHSVEHDKIDQYGTCYPKEIFDPHGLSEEDYFIRLAKEWEQFDEQRRRSKQRTEFVKGGTETVRVGSSGLSNSSAAASIVAQAKAQAASRASKWDSSSRR